MSILDSSHARSVEAVALGLAMGDTDALHVVLSGLASTDYSTAHHRALHALLAERQAEGSTVSLMEDIHRRGADRFGGLPYVCEIQDAIPSYRRDAAPVVREVLDLSHRRQVAELGRQMVALASGEMAEIDGQSTTALSGQEAAATARAALDQIVADNAGGTVQVWDALDEEDQRREAGGKVHEPIPTGIDALDDVLLGGMWPTDLVLVGGRPGWGKTSLTLCIAIEAAICGRVVAFFPMEMPPLQVAQRAEAILSGVPLAKIVKDKLSTDEWTAVLEARDVLKGLPLHIDRRSSLTHAQVTSTMRALRAEVGVVDHLQRMTHPNLSRLDVAMGVTTQAFKNYAKDNDALMIVNVQLNREIDKRRSSGGARWIDDMGTPRKSDIRECGTAEQEADTILFPLRPTDEVAQRPDLTGTEAAVAIAKHRRGESDMMLDVYFDGPITKFSDIPTQTTDLL